jgi:hypothetical protein
MTRAAVVLVLAVAVLLTSTAARADDPPWMPAPPEPVGGAAARQEEARKLRSQGAVYTGLGIGLFGAGVAVNVLALDYPQGGRTMAQGGGIIRTDPVYDAANWAELAGGIVLVGGGITLIVIGGMRLRQAAQLASY